MAKGIAILATIYVVLAFLTADPFSDQSEPDAMLTRTILVQKIVPVYGHFHLHEKSNFKFLMGYLLVSDRLVVGTSEEVLAGFKAKGHKIFVENGRAGIPEEVLGSFEALHERLRQHVGLHEIKVSGRLVKGMEGISPRKAMVIHSITFPEEKKSRKIR